MQSILFGFPDVEDSQSTDIQLKLSGMLYSSNSVEDKRRQLCHMYAILSENMDLCLQVLTSSK